MEKEWKWFTVDFSDVYYGSFWFVPTFQLVVTEHAIYPNKEVIINKPNHPYQYKFLFDWQDEDTCGIEVYRRLKD